MKQANLWRYQPKLGGFQSLTDFKSLDSININKLILWKVARMEHLAPSPGIAQSTQGTRSGPSRDTNWGENLCVSEGESAQGNTCKVTFTQVEILTGAKRREWMGCWGLLGWLLLVIYGSFPHSPRLAPVRLPSQPWTASASGSWRFSGCGLVWYAFLQPPKISHNPYRFPRWVLSFGLTAK